MLMSYGGLFSGTFFIGIPIFAITFFLAKKFTRFNLKPEWNRNMWMLWGMSAVIFIASAISTAAHFQTDASINEVYEYKINENPINIKTYSNRSGSSILNLDGLKLSKKAIVSDNISVQIGRSDSKLVVINRHINSHGLHLDDAQEKAKQVNHKIKVQGNEIMIPEFFELERGSKFRGQRIEYEILIPEGKTVEFDRSISGVHTRIDKSESYDSPRSLYKNSWTMESEGFVAKKWLEKNSFEKKYDFKDFKKLHIQGEFETEIKYGNKYNVRIVGNRENSESLDVVSSTDMLSIMGDEHYDTPLKLFITTPSLASVHFINTSDARVEGFNQNEMELVKNGRFDLKTYVDVDQLSMELKGSGLTTLIGNGNHLTLKLSDYSKLDAERYNAKTATLKGRNYKRSYINVSDKLKYDKRYSLNLDIFGDPQIEGLDK